MTYTKTINGRQVFSTCHSIQLEFDHPPLVKGQFVSNPSQELVLSDGWQIYTPPEVIPNPQMEPDYEQVMQAVKTMLASSVENLSDDEALNVAALYPTWSSRVGEQVNVGERLWYDGKLYKVIQQHTEQEDWTPDVTASLYTEVSIEEWPEFVQPVSAESAYMIGDKVTFEGRHYVSLIDYNTYSPAAYPQGWREQ